MTLRYEFLATQYAPMIATRFSAGVGQERDAFRRFAEKVDPTGQDSDKPWRYLAWACCHFLSTEPAILEEDLYKIGEDLALFETRKKQKRITGPEADIGRYTIKTLADKAMELNGIEFDSYEARLRAAPASVMRETTILKRDAAGIALVPHSLEAAIFWSRGTRWCTGAERSKNKFHHYNKDGPLVILSPAGTKDWYQIHQRSSLKDARDNDAEIDEALEALLSGIGHRFWQRQSLIEERCQGNWNDKAYVLQRVSQAGCNLQHAPKALRHDRDVVLAAVRNDARALEYANPVLRADRKIVLEAVRQDGFWGLAECDPQFRADREIALEALCSNEAADTYIDPLLKTIDFYKETLPRNLKIVPKIKVSDWNAIDAKTKVEAFQKGIVRDWQAITYAADCGVALTALEQKDLFSRARKKSLSFEVQAALHLFPALREAWKNGPLSLDQAAAILDRACQASRPDPAVSPQPWPVLLTHP